ncbi:hypothetical protein [Sphingomonas sp. PvP055]|uniref:hypothetical protein n=1 Tax=Sphingomonas sp. PvP055 TaxID=3156391 RepID=UPI00339B377D
MLLAGDAKSPEAEALVRSIIDIVIAPYMAGKVQARPTMLVRYREALGPFLSDLLHGIRAGRWSKLRTNNSEIASYPGRATAFKAMRDSLKASGLLEELPGFFMDEEERFGQTYKRAAMTSFRPTLQLVQMAEDHGVILSNLSTHFAVGSASPPAACDVIEARARKETKTSRAVQVPIDPADPKASALVASMEGLNAYLMAPGRIEGIVFAGLRRLYSHADQPGFKWQWGGRFHSMPKGDAYETMSDGGDEGGRGRRARAAILRIDGEEVEEVDLSAAHLTILHGLLNLPFDANEAPYALPDLDPKEVKRWVMIALGASDPNAGGPRCSKVRQAASKRFPVLEGLAACGINTHDLQYHEAEIMMMAMTKLQAQGIGFLPVHDALIVPKSKHGVGVEVLGKAFEQYFTERLGMASAPVPKVH